MTWPELVSPWLGIGLSLMMEISLSVEAVCPSAIHSAMQITFVALYAKLLKIKVSATFCSLSVFHLCSPMATPDGILRRPGFVMTSCIAGNIIGNRRSSPRRAGKIERR
uniref:Secreted protein n=1 Tax=Oryza nivara TaxID=4536 RepID=A0A0E0J2K8_ORYNI